MKKNTINYIIDILLLLQMVSIAAIGILMKYTLLSGREATLLYGSPIDLYFKGLDRHQWGAIHLYVSISFLVVLVLHLIFHWSQIKQLHKNLFKNPIISAIAYFIFITSFLIIVLPLFIQPKVMERQTLGSQQNKRFNAKAIQNQAQSKKAIKEQVQPEKFTSKNKKQEIHTDHKHQLDFEIKGYLTIQRVSAKANISSQKIITKLGLPLNTNPNERLGQLRRQYDFTMSDVEKIIINHRETNP